MTIRPDHRGNTTNPAADEAAVRGLYQQLMDGWNRGSGKRFKGRKEIGPFHQQLFDRWMKGTRLVGQVEDVRFLSPDVAVMHAVGGTVMPGKTKPSPERDSIQTLVATR